MCNRVSVAARPAASQCEINRFHILVWWVMPVSICATTCCSSNVTQRCEQPDLATHSARWCVCVCGICGCVSSLQQRNENEKTPSPHLIYIHSKEIMGQSVRCVRELCFSCQHKHLCTFMWVCDWFWVWFPLHLPSVHWSELVDWNGKQTEAKRGEWLQVCMWACVCVCNCGVEEKFKWKAVFTLDLLDKNVGVVFFNVLRKLSSHWSTTNNILSLQQGLMHKNMNCDEIPNISFEQHYYKWLAKEKFEGSLNNYGLIIFLSPFYSTLCDLIHQACIINWFWICMRAQKVGCLH